MASWLWAIALFVLLNSVDTAPLPDETAEHHLAADESRIGMIRERQSQIEMRAYSNGLLDPAPAAQRAADQARELGAKVKAVSLQAERQRKAVRSGFAAATQDLGEPRDQAAAASAAQEAHQAAAEKAVHALELKHLAETDVALKLAHPDLLPTAQKVALQAGLKATQAREAELGAHKLALQKQHQLAQSRRAAAEAALHKALPNVQKTQVSQVEAGTKLEEHKIGQAVAQLESHMSKIDLASKQRSKDMAKLAAQAGVPTDDTVPASAYGPRTLDEARSHFQREAALAAQRLSAANAAVLSGNMDKKDLTAAAKDQATLVEANQTAAAALEKEHKIEEATQLAIKVDQEKTELAKDQANQLEQESEQATADVGGTQRAADQAASNAAQAEKELADPVAELEKAESAADAINSELADQTRRLSEMTSQKRNVSAQVLSVLGQEHELIKADKANQANLREAQRIIDIAKSKQESAIQHAALAKQQERKAAMLEQHEQGKVANQAIVIRKGQQRVSQAKQKLRQAKVDAVEASLELSRTAQSARPSTGVEAGLKVEKVEALLSKAADQAQQRVSDAELQIRKDKLEEEEDEATIKKQKTLNQQASAKAEAVKQKLDKQQDKVHTALSALSRDESEASSAAAEAGQYTDVIQEASRKVAAAQLEANTLSSLQNTKQLRIGKDKVSEKSAKALVAAHLSEASKYTRKLDHLHTALQHARKQESAAQQAAETVYMSDLDSARKSQVIQTLAESKFNVHKAERLIQKTRSKQASAQAEQVKLKMQAAQVGAQLARDEEDLSQVETNRQSQMNLVKESEAARDKAKQDGAPAIQESSKLQQKLMSQHLAVKQAERAAHLTKRDEAGFQSQLADGDQKLKSETSQLKKQLEQINQLKLEANADKAALDSTVSRKQSLEDAQTTESDAEHALEIEMSNLKQASRQEAAMHRAFSQTKRVEASDVNQVHSDASLAQRATRAKSKLQVAEREEKAKVRRVKLQAESEERKLGEIKKQVSQLRAHESNQISKGQEALAVEVNAKAKVSRAQARARAAKAKAASALTVAQKAGPLASELKVKAKNAEHVAQDDKTKLAWAMKVGLAEEELAKQEAQVAIKDMQVAGNRTLKDEESLKQDDDLRQRVASDEQAANDLVARASRLTSGDSSSSRLVEATEQIQADDEKAAVAQVQVADAKLATTKSLTQKLQHEFDTRSLEADDSLRTAGNAAREYGQADTAERVALEKLKTLLPSDEAFQLDTAAERARTSPPVSEASDQQQELWAVQNAKELELASKIGAKPATTLGESQANRPPTPVRLARTLRKAQIGLDVGLAKEALSSASQQDDRPWHAHQGGRILELMKNLQEATNSIPDR